MENQISFQTKLNHATKWGGIASLILIVYHLIIYFLKWNIYNPGVSLLSFVVNFAVAIIFTYKGSVAYKNNIANKFLPYWQGFLMSFMIGLVAFYFVAFYKLLFDTIIDPNYKFEQFENFKVIFESNPFISEELREELIAETEKNIANPFKQFSYSLFSNAIFIGILSLIMAFFVKSKEEIKEAEF